jgi:membrane associated rhomboid family serine protease
MTTGNYMTVTNLIILITCIVSYFCFNNQNLFNKLSHHPYSEKRFKEYYRFITSGFVHGDWAHLGINMFVLWQFGSLVEEYFKYHFGNVLGMVYFVAIYFATIIISDIPTYRKHQDFSGFRSVGASGATSGIVFIIILFQPWGKLYLYGIIPLYNILAGILYIGYSHYASTKNNDNIDHSAHLTGALAGMMLTVALKPSIWMDFIHSIIQNRPF